MRYWRNDRVILFTAAGERVMKPDFGCGVHAHVGILERIGHTLSDPGTAIPRLVAWLAEMMLYRLDHVCVPGRDHIKVHQFIAVKKKHADNRYTRRAFPGQ
jgi:hypothetical protein